jgi:hypothetical protein
MNLTNEHYAREYVERAIARQQPGLPKLSIPDS